MESSELTQNRNSKQKAEEEAGSEKENHQKKKSKKANKSQSGHIDLSVPAPEEITLGAASLTAYPAIHSLMEDAASSSARLPTAASSAASVPVTPFPASPQIPTFSPEQWVYMKHLLGSVATGSAGSSPLMPPSPASSTSSAGRASTPLNGETRR